MTITKSRVDRAADRISKGQESSSDLNAVRLYRDARAPLLAEFVRDLLPNVDLEMIAVAGRVKRISSIVRKCRRARTRISALEDLVGYRVVVRDVEAQNALRSELTSWPRAARVRDYTSSPRQDGYRALHVVLQYALDGQTSGRIEIQVRTVWQHIWANVSEGFGLAVKEGGGSESTRQYLGSLSINLAKFDAHGEMPQGWEGASTMTGAPHLAVFDARRRIVRSVESFSDMERALETLLVRERSDLLDAVLLVAASPAVIRKSHIGLFPRELVNIVAQIPPFPTAEQVRALLSPV